uniref:Elongin A binding-protein 1 domain-containing protein n=1 Tax=Meloidogyne javanica TaxID=6303 RepID=A0A915LJQ3_MELJA
MFQQKALQREGTFGQKEGTFGKLTEQQKLVPLDPNNRKVELQIRQTKLKKIYEEYVKICVNDPKMAIESAQLEEKEILDGCAIKNAYMIAMPHVIRRLRNFMANHENPQRNP